MFGQVLPQRLIHGSGALKHPGKIWFEENDVRALLILLKVFSSNAFRKVVLGKHLVVGSASFLTYHLFIRATQNSTADATPRPFRRMNAARSCLYDARFRLRGSERGMAEMAERRNAFTDSDEWKTVATSGSSTTATVSPEKREAKRFGTAWE